MNSGKSSLVCTQCYHYLIDFPTARLSNNEGMIIIYYEIHFRPNKTSVLFM